jgi:hypothetical protein
VADSSTAPHSPAPLDLHRQRQADAIYGTIVTASVLASAGDELSSLLLALSVLLTVGVYWIADVYAELLAGPITHGRLPDWPHVRTELLQKSPMVSASFSPLVLLLLAWLFGASRSAAATTALVGAIVVVVFYAWAAGRAAELRGFRLIVVMSTGALLGVLMIVLKNVLLVQLH